MRKRTVAVFITFHHLSRSASYTGLAIIALAVVTLSSLIFAHATVGFVNLLTRKSCLEMYAFCAASAVIWNSTVAFIDYVVSNTALTPEGCFRARAGASCQNITMDLFKFATSTSPISCETSEFARTARKFRNVLVARSYRVSMRRTDVALRLNGRLEIRRLTVTYFGKDVVHLRFLKNEDWHFGKLGNNKPVYR